MSRAVRFSLFAAVLVGIAGMSLSCGNAADFTVEMRRSDDTSDVLRLGVKLPSSGHEEDVVFLINDVAYQSDSVLTVRNPELVFEDVNGDDFQSVTLKLPGDERDDAVLCVVTVGGDELSYYADGTDFNILLEYLSKN